MATYRVLPGHTLALKHGEVAYAGSLVRLPWLEKNLAGLQALVDKGAIARVAPPPLTVLPGWKVRGRKAQVHGIEDAEQFLEASDADLAEWMGTKEEMVRRWKSELSDVLKAPRGKCCGG